MMLYSDDLISTSSVETIFSMIVSFSSISVICLHFAPQMTSFLFHLPLPFGLAAARIRRALKFFVEPLNLSVKKAVIFPVNDNEDVTQAEGGSHWSLLAFERDSNLSIHHDSYGGANSRYARRLHASVVGFMGSSESNGRYMEYTQTPQQVNGYDCGLYVTAIARAICCWYRSGGSNDDKEGFWFSVVKEEVTPSAFTAMRSEILGLIRGLMDK
ncbi:hypothetical protein Ancab_008266 [Ancistrocladus abbreviatus]